MNLLKIFACAAIIVSTAHAMDREIPNLGLDDASPRQTQCVKAPQSNNIQEINEQKLQFDFDSDFEQERKGKNSYADDHTIDSIPSLGMY